MARIVALKDHGPLIIRTEAMDTDSVAICRCGLSANWPYCDGTHAVTKGEEPGKAHGYPRETKDERPERKPAVDITLEKFDPRPWTKESEE